MPLTNIRVPTASADVVGVFDQNFNQLFSQATSMKVTVSESSELMKHTLEDGAKITDHAVFDPNTIELSVMVSGQFYRSIFQQIKQVYKSRTIVTIQTKADSYENMVISKMPHDEDPEMFDAIIIAISLEEARFTTPQYGTLPPAKVANKSQASTVDKGQQQTAPANDEQTARGGLLYRLFHRGS